MHSDSPDDTTPDPSSRMRAVIEETRRTIEASRAVLDGCEDGAAPGGSEPCGGPDTLGEISDGLIHAHRFAEQDGDPLTVILIEKALLHVGRRLARGLSPADASLVCH